jgi:hypothetical protein
LPIIIIIIIILDDLKATLNPSFPPRGHPKVKLPVPTPSLRLDPSVPPCFAPIEPSV